jgi:trehalose 6-phosphate synthase/phosphatase
LFGDDILSKLKRIRYHLLKGEVMRLVVVSNRLPVTLTKKGGRYVITESSGGLVSGLSSYLDSIKGSSSASKVEYVWVGWPGIEVDDKFKSQIQSETMEKYHSMPVFLTSELMENFYEGFCNNTIWPLFHYFPTFAVYDREYWEFYKIVNEKFLKVVMSVLRPDDIVWVHDYHLMLLPGMLRKKMPDLKMGFFLHIPFPTYEIFSLLPSSWRAEILDGLLGSDLIGFHTYSDTQYFLRCVLRILGRESDLGNIPVETRMVKADTFPMGIDFMKFHDALNSPEVQKEREELKKIFNHEKIILSIDRLDYTKGILNRLLAYEIFLENNPEWIGKIILLLKVIPSRIGVKQYRKIKKQIDEEVGKINGKFGTMRWTPISYQFGFISFYPLVALYSISDIMLVTPLRDGMNLISKEYLASRYDKTGVLVLSEMAGASKELGEAVIINPNNKEEIASAIRDAMTMSHREQKRRITIMQARLRRYDVVRWADDFIQKIISTAKEREFLGVKLLSGDVEQKMQDDFRKSERSIIFLDYDGTLVPFTGTPEDAVPGKELLELLNEFKKMDKADLVLVSGRDKDTLGKWFGELDLDIIAEHGSLIKQKGREWKFIKSLHGTWKPQILPILEMYVDRLPGSFIEEKESSLVWHYRKADPELSVMRTRELLDHLYSFTANIDVNILKGNKVIEIRNSGINKGSAALNWITKKDYDFILAIGDDWTDEDLFKILPEWAYTIKVGSSETCSNCFLPDHKAVYELLKRLSD